MSPKEKKSKHLIVKSNFNNSGLKEVTVKHHKAKLYYTDEIKLSGAKMAEDLLSE